MIVLLGVVILPAKIDEIPALPDVGPTICIHQSWVECQDQMMGSQVDIST